MILPDVNLLVYAHDELAPFHGSARKWWESSLSGSGTVGLPWAVSLGFVRLVTHPAVVREPLSPAAALARVRSWLARPQVEILEPGPRHLELLGRLFDAAGVAGRLTTDAHLAALAIEHNGELQTTDADFARFPGLRWRDPIGGSKA